MRVPILCCACFFVCFGLARLAFTSARPPDAPPISQAIAVPKADVAIEQANRSNAEASRQRLSMALEGDDPLISAARSLVWLETTTIEDFQRLAADPKNFPFPEFSGFDYQFRELFYTALVERWLTLDPENGLSAIQKIEGEVKKNARSTSEWLLNIAARIRPEMVLKQLPLEDKRGALEFHSRYALQTLAQRDANAARRFLDRFDHSQTRRAAELAIAEGIIESDPLKAVSLVQQFGEDWLYSSAMKVAVRIGPNVVRRLVSAAGGKLDNHPDIPKLVLQYPDLGADLTNPEAVGAKNPVTPELRRAADRIDPAERARILESYDKLTPGVRDSLVAALASSWARTEPLKAAEWAISHAKPEDRAAPENRAADQVFLRWVNTDSDAALAWWRSLPDSPLRDALGSNASTFIAERGQLDVALQMCRPQSGEDDSTIAAQLTQYVVERDPAGAASWLKDLPAELDTSKAAQAVISSWYPRNPEAVARWIESLPAGARRDSALGVFVEKAAQHNAMGAAEWVGTLTDPKLRQDAALRVYLAMRWTDPSSADEWMRSLRGVDPEWRDRIVRRMK